MAPATSDNIKVCIVGQNASLKFGGEASTPWFYFKYMRARGIDAHMVVHGRTQEELREAFPHDIDRIHTVNDSSLDRFLYRLGKFLPAKIDCQTLGVFRHLVTQLRQRKVIQRLVRDKKVQIVHETTPVAPRQISALCGLRVPVVIGPLSGGMTYPPAFRFMESRVTRAVEVTGRALSYICNLCVPGKRKAAALIVANDLTRRCLPWGVHGDIYQIPEVGVDLQSWNGSRSTTDGNIRFVYLGRLVDWKGVTFLLDAFKPVAEQMSDVFLDIIGDGEERGQLERQAASLGIADRIHFHAYLHPVESSRLVRQSDVMVLPSLHECGGMVILEAMALGLPVIAANWAGPAVHVTDDTGIKVNPNSRREFVEGLTTAMLKMARSPDLRRQMGAAGRRRLATEPYDWGTKVTRMMDIYRQTLSARAS